MMIVLKDVHMWLWWGWSAQSLKYGISMLPKGFHGYHILLVPPQMISLKEKVCAWQFKHFCLLNSRVSACPSLFLFSFSPVICFSFESVRKQFRFIQPLMFFMLMLYRQWASLEMT